MLKTATKVVSILPPKGKAKQTELKVLDSYVEQIRLWASQSMQTDAIPFGDFHIPVTAWTARAIQRFCNAPAPPQGKLDDLATEAVALIAKCRTDMGAGVSGQEDENDLNALYARQAETMLDVAVGSVVLRQLQQKCSELLADGRNEDMRELNALQHEVRKTVQEARGSLGKSEQQRANEFVTAFGGEVESADNVEAEPATLPLATSKSGAPSPRRPKVAQSRRAPRKRSEQATFVLPSQEPVTRSGRMQTYVFWFVILAMVGGMAVVGVNRFRSAPPIEGDVSHSLTTALSDFPGVTKVQDRRPYVLLTVHASFWETTNKSRRQTWIQDLSRLAERHGYSGLMLRSTGGVPLAEWVQGRGIKYPDET